MSHHLPPLPEKEENRQVKKLARPFLATGAASPSAYHCFPLQLPVPSLSQCLGLYSKKFFDALHRKVTHGIHLANSKRVGFCSPLDLDKPVRRCHHEIHVDLCGGVFQIIQVEER